MVQKYVKVRHYLLIMVRFKNKKMDKNVSLLKTTMLEFVLDLPEDIKSVKMNIEK